MTTPVRHVIWDWNGTLLDDAEFTITLTIQLFERHGFPPLTAEMYRENFTRPIPAFFEKVLGRPLERDEWASLDAAFHNAYHQGVEALQLAAGAAETMNALRDAGITQSLLSLHPHDMLIATINDRALGHYFERVDGALQGRHETKERALREHVQALGIAPDEAVLIGDSVDDAEAAQMVGVQPLLVRGGLHAESHLERVGVPLLDSLPEALAYVLPAMVRND